LNIDACFFPNGTGATGPVLRDSKGHVVAGVSRVLCQILDATTEEAIALQNGLQLIEGLGCALVVIETDSLELVQAYNGVIDIWSPYTAILADCFQRTRGIGHVTVQHCFRQANGTTHHLARVTYDSRENLLIGAAFASFRATL
jgi:ribonuclease HI